MLVIIPNVRYIVHGQLALTIPPSVLARANEVIE
jgi:hypothetical protein